MKTYQITIGRETFPIKSDASEEHVQHLAKTIQERYEQMNTRKGPRASQGFRAMTMV
ncbi:MAG: cell division protein ZapA, partial [Deltaproteobacteria bacterium]|nr:cell division protein ZapA [Deltaproteobacteria bacterium]